MLPYHNQSARRVTQNHLKCIESSLANIVRVGWFIRSLTIFSFSVASRATFPGYSVYTKHCSLPCVVFISQTLRIHCKQYKANRCPADNHSN